MPMKLKKTSFKRIVGVSLHRALARDRLLVGHQALRLILPKQKGRAHVQRTRRGKSLAKTRKKVAFLHLLIHGGKNTPRHRHSEGLQCLQQEGLFAFLPCNQRTDQLEQLQTKHLFQVKRRQTRPLRRV